MDDRMYELRLHTSSETMARMLKDFSPLENIKRSRLFFFSLSFFTSYISDEHGNEAENVVDTSERVP